MKNQIPVITRILLLSLLFSATTSSKRALDKTAPEPGFAVVELFTSEGCSSCPPADEIVSHLDKKKNIYVLGFHVDYWNYLGWKDIFSDPAYSGRQKQYGSIFHLANIYTPQIIVNGRTEMVGSEENKLQKTIDGYLEEKPGYIISLQVQPVTNNKVLIKGQTNGNTETQFNLALVQNMATDHIQRGENQGKTLYHFHIVRNFHVNSIQNGSISDEFSLPIGLSPRDCTLIAYLQNKKSGQIVAATSSDIR